MPNQEGQGLVTRDELPDMQTTAVFEGLRCLTCESETDAPAQRCPDCGGPLRPAYDGDALTSAVSNLFEDTGNAPIGGETTGLGRFEEVLPFDADTLVSLGEGGTPLVDCPRLTDTIGATVQLKSEGCNPTGGLPDREMALAVTAAREQDANTVVLPTTGNGGQAAAAYAARAGLDARAFVPARAAFDAKAMINVHGGEMDVVGGRYGDAVDAFQAARESFDEGAYSLAPFETPYRHEGAKTLAYELAGAAPDAVVHPTGHGIGFVALYRGFRELAAGGVVDMPRLYMAQPEGCAPLVSAVDGGVDASAPELTPVEYPDTICGSLEVADPAGGSAVLAAIDATDGGAVAIPDDTLLDTALDQSRAGVPVSATGATAVAGTERLATTGALSDSERVVIVDPVSPNREADVLRSRLMSEGK